MTQPNKFEDLNDRFTSLGTGMTQSNKFRDRWCTLLLVQILLEGILYRVLSVDIYSSGLNKSLIKVSNFICSMASATDQPRRFPDAYEK